MDEPYRFKEKPAAKSSSSVLVATPGVIACPTCGCLMTGEVGDLGVKIKKGCECRCHQ